MPRDKKTSTPARKTAALKAVPKHAPKRNGAKSGQRQSLTERPDAPLGYHILASARAYSHALQLALAAKPATAKLTVPRLQALQIIASNDGIHGADLACALDVTPQTVTTILNSLLDNGWIDRRAGKGRALKAYLTKEGRAQLNKGIAVLLKVDETLAGTYSHDGAEADVLTDLLRMGRQSFGLQAA